VEAVSAEVGADSTLLVLLMKFITSMYQQVAGVKKPHHVAAAGF